MSARDRRPLRAAALAALATLLSTQAAALIDVATFQHVTCPEHGELIHTDDPAAAVASYGAGITEAPSDAGHDHEHCPVTALGRDQAVAADETARHTFFTFALISVPGRALASHAPLALLGLAPKASPPPSVA